MNRDPVVEEVHQARQRLLKECSGDLDRLMDRLKYNEKRLQCRNFKITFKSHEKRA